MRRLTVALKTRTGGGSGVIWSQEGRIVTNAHVVDQAGDTLQAELWDGRSLHAKVVQRDRRRDLAVVEIRGSGLPAAAVGDSDSLRAGELVIAVGNPLGFIGAASTGVVYGFDHREWVVSQLRLAPGNSGGPLANARGEVIGINTMVSGSLAFAVPAAAILRFLDPQRPVDIGLGVVVRPIVTGRSAPEFGLIVLEVVANSPAARASLLQGDVLTGAFGRRFASPRDLEGAIRANHGGILELQFRRGANPAIRTVIAQMASAAARAA
ncbi:MAG TPA: trypsin-like peptidase domain-containing protein [Bryobacteraceae bacterium]|nr:trypsin-like peptidase domain-containing protein [Bryobacteraceae bacterium]